MFIGLRNLWLFSRIVCSVIETVVVLMIGRCFVKTSRKNEFVYSTIANWGRKVLDILDVKVKIVGEENIKFFSNCPYLIMSNHVSFLDIPLIYAVFNRERVTMVAKKELFKIPFLGLGMKIVGSIKIDRKNPKQAFQDLENAKKQMLKGIRVWIAPEGTRSRTGKIGNFKRGGFKIAKDLSAMILPVTIKGAEGVWPVGGINFRPKRIVEMVIHPAIDSKNYSLEHLISLTKEVISGQEIRDIV